MASEGAKENATRSEEKSDKYSDKADTYSSSFDTSASAAGNTANSLASDYSNFDADAYAKKVAEASSAMNAYNARRSGSNAAKAAQLGNVGNAQTYANAQATGTELKNTLGSTAYNAQANQASQYAGQQQAAAENELGYEQLKSDAETAKDAATNDTIKSSIGAVSNIAGAFATKSDIRVKENITPDSSLEEIMSKIRPIQFDYKKQFRENPNDDKRKIGISAQDLEQTPLSGAVVESPEGIKKIDTGTLSTANTALIVEMYDYIRALENKINAIQNNTGLEQKISQLRGEQGVK